MSRHASPTELTRAWTVALSPPPDLRVSEWAESDVILPESFPVPGPYRADREPYHRGILDALHEAALLGADTVVVQASAQAGKTLAMLLIAANHMANDPCPILLIEPTEALAKRISRNRLGPLIASTPALRAVVADGRGRRSDATLLHKTFPGGFLEIVGANSATPLSSESIRLLLADEIDKYPEDLGDAGDPLSLGLARTKRYWNRLHVLMSTPTLKGSSRIESWYALSDQRRFMVPCPHCGHRDYLTWDDEQHFFVKYEGEDASTAHLRCVACQGRIEDHERPAMIALGAWQATAEVTGIVGFHIWEAYTATSRLAIIVRNFLRARKLGLASVHEFKNQTLGETWEQPGTRIESHVLLERREPYPNAREGYVGDLPAKVCVLVAGVDTQDDRLELHVWGYGPGEESWLIDVQIIPGDPQNPGPWTELDRLLEVAYRHVTGISLRIVAACVDSAGHRTQPVYDFCRRPSSIARGVRAIIGRAGADRAFAGPPSPRGYGRDARQVDLFTVGTDQGNSVLTSRLLLATEGPGYVHLPLGHHRVGEEYAAQLAGMRLQLRKRKGQVARRQEWIAMRPRVEARDAAIYALAALRHADPGGHQLQSAWPALLAAYVARSREPAVTAPSPPLTVPAPSGRRMGRSMYLMVR